MWITASTRETSRDNVPMTREAAHLKASIGSAVEIEGWRLFPSVGSVIGTRGCVRELMGELTEVQTAPILKTAHYPRISAGHSRRQSFPRENTA